MKRGLNGFRHFCIWTFAFSLGWQSSPSFAHTGTKLGGECPIALSTGRYQGKTVILDANIVMYDEHALEKFDGADIVLPSILIDELDDHKYDMHVGHKVRHVFRQLSNLFSNMNEQDRVELPNGSTLSVDSRNLTKALRNISYDKKKRDNSSYLALSLTLKNAGKDVILVTDDVSLGLKAKVEKIPTESYRDQLSHNVAPPLNFDELAEFTITDEEMENLRAHNQIPLPVGLPMRPNQFIQFVSPARPVPNQAAIARFVYKRPVSILQLEPTTDQLENGEFQLTQVAFPDTLRVKIDHKPVPEISNGSTDGWYLDTSSNKIVFQGSALMRLHEHAQVSVEGQVEAHRMERMKSFKELGMWNIRARSLEQTMALNLGLDDSIDCVVQEGKAGSSKTFNYVAAVLRLQMDKSKKYLPYMVRPPAYHGGHDPGAAPGDFLEKNKEFLEPYVDAYAAIQTLRNAVDESGKPGKRITKMPDDWGFVPYEFVRGRSIPNALIGVDEFQNTERSEAGTVLSRGATNTRYFISGDVTQIDPPLTATTNGLAELISIINNPELTLEEQSRFGYVRLTTGVRSPFSEMISNLTAKSAQRR